MSQKMAFLNTDNQWYWAVYNDQGDFAKLIGPFASLIEANKSQGVPETTPAGEYIKDETPVVSQDEAKGVDPVTDPEVTPAQVEATKEELEKAPEGVIVENTNTAPEQTPAETTTEPTAPVAPAEPTAVVDVNEETKTVTFDNGDTAPLVSREEVVAQSSEAEVAKAEAEATPATPEAPVAPENAPATPATDTPVEGQSAPVENTVNN